MVIFWRDCASLLAAGGWIRVYACPPKEGLFEGRDVDFGPDSSGGISQRLCEAVGDSPNSFCLLIGRGNLFNGLGGGEMGGFVYAPAWVPALVGRRRVYLEAGMWPHSYRGVRVDLLMS